MQQHRLHVDFNSKDKWGRILLGTAPTIRGGKGKRIKLEEGLLLTICNGEVQIPAVLQYRDHMWVASIYNPYSEWSSAS